ncbi:MAG: hypothetical protein JST36_07635 [Bacteroidetes bacterium]|nr:hypothetical protein [Bacteroidota bacterium]
MQTKKIRVNDCIVYGRLRTPPYDAISNFYATILIENGKQNKQITFNNPETALEMIDALMTYLPIFREHVKSDLEDDKTYTK